MDELRSARNRRLQHLHGIMVELVMHEGRFVSERTNLFLLFNSILFAGFLILRTQAQTETWLTLAAGTLVPILGIGFSFVQKRLIGSNIAAANFWRSTAGLIQEDEDFWWPRKTIHDCDLDFFHARTRAARGEPTRQMQRPIRGEGVAFEGFGPNTIMSQYLPFTFFILWLFALAWVIAIILAATTPL